MQGMDLRVVTATIDDLAAALRDLPWWEFGLYEADQVVDPQWPTRAAGMLADRLAADAATDGQR